MGNKARLRIDESFDIKKMVQDIDELYQIQLSPDKGFNYDNDY